MDVSFHVGLPQDFPVDRIARIKGFPLAPLMLHIHELPWRLILGLMWPRSLVSRSLINPRVNNPDAFDTPDFWHLDFASAIGYGQARSIATIYGDLVSGDSRIGITGDTLDQLTARVQPPSQTSLDMVSCL